MPEVSWVLFLTASVLVIVAPGPDNILVLTRGITLGRRAALISATGASVGLVIHSLFATVGLSALLAGSAAAFAGVKYAGAAYLVYLGVRALLSRDTFVIWRGAPAITDRKVFLQGVVSNVLNPKIAVFFVAFLPQFVAPGAAAAPQFAALGLSFALLTWALFSAIGLFSGAIGEVLSSRPLYAGLLRWVTGGVLVGLGVRLALERR